MSRKRFLVLVVLFIFFLLACQLKWMSVKAADQNLRIISNILLAASIITIFLYAIKQGGQER